jgi:hypothetical protein
LQNNGIQSAASRINPDDIAAVHETLLHHLRSSAADLGTPAGLSSRYAKIPAANKAGAMQLRTQLREASSDAAYTTVSCEAEFLENRSDLQVAEYRVSFAAAGLRSRRLAIAPTLVTWHRNSDRVAFVNSYYGSMMKRDLDPTYSQGVNGIAGDDGSPSYNFFPYAIVRVTQTPGFWQY